MEYTIARTVALERRIRGRIEELREKLTVTKRVVNIFHNPNDTLTQAETEYCQYYARLMALNEVAYQIRVQMERRSAELGVHDIHAHLEALHRQLHAILPAAKATPREDVMPTPPVSKNVSDGVYHTRSRKTLSFLSLDTIEEFEKDKNRLERVQDDLQTRLRAFEHEHGITLSQTHVTVLRNENLIE